MKLMPNFFRRQQGFALPTILMVSVVMITVLVASIGAAAASRVALDAQYYNQLARLAADSGTARAIECLRGNGYVPEWTTEADGKALRPHTGCDGTGSSYSPYIVQSGNLRTTFSVDAEIGAGAGSRLKITGRTELIRTSTNSEGGHDVWRTYDYVKFQLIDAPEVTMVEDDLCPAGFVIVPGNMLLGTSDFCVMKYEAKNVGGEAVSQADSLPWVSISQTNAITAAAAACSGCHLITEGEWLTIAHNAMNVASNWTGPSVGSGSLYIGHSDGSPSSALAASTDDDGYFQTGNGSGVQRRTLTLSNGSVIWDFAGNVDEWTSGKTPFDESDQPGRKGYYSYTWADWKQFYVYPNTTGNLSPEVFPDAYETNSATIKTWDSSKGIGAAETLETDKTVRAFKRGGHWSLSGNSGIFTLSLSSLPSASANSVGFRVAAPLA